MVLLPFLINSRSPGVRASRFPLIAGLNSLDFQRGPPTLFGDSVRTEPEGPRSRRGGRRRTVRARHANFVSRRPTTEELCPRHRGCNERGARWHIPSPHGGSRARRLARPRDVFLPLSRARRNRFCGSEARENNDSGYWVRENHPRHLVPTFRVVDEREIRQEMEPLRFASDLAAA